MRRKLNKLIVFIENQNTSIAVSKKERLVLILLTFMVVESILFKIFTTPDSWMYTVVVGSVTIFAIFLLVIKKKGKFIEQYKLKYFILLEIVGVSFVFNGIYFGTLAYLAIGITFSVVIPTIHYAFSMINKDIDMMEIMAKGIILAFILCFVASMLFGPGLGSEQYKGLFPNPNLLGYFLNIVFAALVLMVMKEDISNKEKVKYYILIGVTLSLLFFTNQRTPMLGAIAQIVYLFVISVIQLIKSNKSVKISQYLKRGIIIAAMMTCCFVTVFLCITTVKTCIANILPEMQFVSTEAGIYKADEVEESVKLSESFGHAEDRFTKGIGQSMDNFTSGRIGIWKNYIDNIEVIGHAKEERQIVSGDRKYASTNAHNVYLQISYSAGIAAGIAVLLIMLVLAKDILSRLKSFILNKEKIDNAFIFVSCIAISFAVFSITSAGYMMYTYIHATYFWITLYYFTMKPEGE